MIRVNLMPHHLRPVKRTPLPYLLSLVVLAGVVVGVFLLFMAKQAEIRSARNDLAGIESELASLSAVVEEYNALSEQKLQLQEKISTIKEILSDRIIWSKQLNRLAELTPDNIWYKRIRVTWQTFKEKQVKTDPKTGQELRDPRTNEVQTEIKNVRRPILEVSGYVINDEQGESKIYPLTESTTEDEEFREMFTLIRPRVDFTEFNGFAVRGFTLEYQITADGGES